MTQQTAVSQKQYVYFERMGYLYRVATRSNRFYDYLIVEAKAGSGWVKTGSLAVHAEARKALGGAL